MSRIGWERIEDLELKEEEDVGIRNRLVFLRILVIFILGLLIYRVWWIQQTRGPNLVEQAEENQFADSTSHVLQCGGASRYDQPRNRYLGRLSSLGGDAACDSNEVGPKRSPREVGALIGGRPSDDWVQPEVA